METIEIKTLVDITNSKVIRYNHADEKEYNQHKNWTTLLQCIGLRAIVSFDEDPTFESVDIKSLGFGSKYKGKQTVWTFRFNTDREATYKNDEGDLSLLVNDLHQVPVIKNLNETINISKAVFDLRDTGWCNTLVSIVQPEITDVIETE